MSILESILYYYLASIIKCDQWFQQAKQQIICYGVGVGLTLH